MRRLERGRRPLVITPGRGSNYGHHANHHANLDTRAAQSVYVYESQKEHRNRHKCCLSYKT